MVSREREAAQQRVRELEGTESALRRDADGLREKVPRYKYRRFLNYPTMPRRYLNTELNKQFFFLKKENERKNRKK